MNFHCCFGSLGGPQACERSLIQWKSMELLPQKWSWSLTFLALVYMPFYLFSQNFVLCLILCLVNGPETYSNWGTNDLNVIYILTQDSEFKRRYGIVTVTFHILSRSYCLFQVILHLAYIRYSLVICEANVSLVFHPYFSPVMYFDLIANERGLMAGYYGHFPYCSMTVESEKDN